MTDRRWTDEEIGLVMDPPAGYTMRQVGELLGRSRGSVLSMRSRVLNGWSPQSEPPLTEVEIDFIRCSPEMTAMEVAKQLGRGYATVTHQRRKLAQSEGLYFGRGPYDKDPMCHGKRRVLAKTCLACGLLWGGAEFVSGRGVCNGCRKTRRRPDDKQGMEEQVERLAERTGIPYRSRHYEPYTEDDCEVLANPNLSVAAKAALIGRTYKATQQAIRSYGFTTSAPDRTEPYGLWRILFDAGSDNEAA